ncbi:hypothetical protein DPMN_131989 [Dreissena polymorpha]|uniref:Uncharacterized protein n=1 Tax=Dreissena polymorpha TaxID=45954 RepID=A0A9D4J8G7_DREPO|nr:hypothetical protein DPMN_131989 [Dreissena polymorpha]
MILSSQPRPLTLELLTGDDKEEPLLSGLDFLPDGRLRLGTPYKFKDHPNGVVCVSHDTLCVTGGGEKVVCLLSVSTDNTITLTREIKTSSQFDSICCMSPSNMVVSTYDDPHFDHFLTFPKKKYKVEHVMYMYDNVNGTSRANPLGACVGPDDTDSIVHLTIHGKILGTYPLEMKTTYSICVSKDGTRLALSSDNHLINSFEIFFNIWQNFIGTNVLTKFHEDWPINVANIVTTAPPLAKKYWIINVTSRVLTRKNATPPCGHFHEHWTTNVTSRVLTRKTAPPHGGHVFHLTGTIFELIEDIIGTHVLTKFHADWTKNVTSRVLTRKTAMPPGGHVFQPTGTIFQLVQDIIGRHVLTKFHEDLTKNVTSRPYKEIAMPPGGHVFQPTETIFELVQDIIRTHVLTKFHEDRTINVTSRVLTSKTATPPGGHVFQSTETIFELVQDIIGTHVRSKFHEDWTINVASRVLTR